MRPPPDGGSVAGTGTAAGEGRGGSGSGGGTDGAGRERDSCNSGGVSDTADEPLLSEPLSMASVQRAAAKRRGTAALGKSSVMTGAFGSSGTPSERLTSIGGGRRRRLLLYTSAFLVMLVLSSVLDVRRATLRSRRRSRVQLALPSGPSLGSTQTTTATSSTNDLPGTAAGNGSSANTSDGGHGGRVVLGAVNSSNPQRVNVPPRMQQQQQQQQQQQKQQQALQPLASGTRHGHQKLSEQELKDDVDQLIAHVEQESSSASNNGTSSSARVGGGSNSSSSVSSVVKSGNGGFSARATPSAGASAAQHIPVNGTATAEEVSSRLTAEEAFAAAQRKIEGFAKNESVKPFLDTNEMRTLQALSLQATRGDCESSASSPGSTGGSLFKTDAEAASNVDIEKSDALWGAWCLFVGSYRSDAMRDYVSKASALEARIERSLQSPGVGGNAGTSPGNAGPPFDERSASLRDVLSLEEEAALVSKAAMVAPHLHENELRYLAALSLQATFGDCGPYANVHEKSSANAVSANGSPALSPRPLTEPVLRKTANRGEGALWGAWCVFQGRKRAFAATQLAERMGLLLSQLAQKLRIGGDQAQSQTRSERDSVLTQSGRLSTQNVVSEAE